MDAEQALIYYEKRPPVRPRSIKGRFRRLKTFFLIVALSLFFITPFLSWPRGPGFPRQAVLYDIGDRIFYLFGLVVWPQQVYWLAILLVLAAILLFFVTGLAGRVWCGYFCFQTLWSDLFLLIERGIQGDRNARIRLDRAPWGVRKLLLKAGTHGAWILVSLATGLAFTAYFTDSFALLRQFFLLRAPMPAYVTTGLLTASTYIFGGLAREQVCTTICPYGRFQSVMFDANTRTVAYDAERGEGVRGRLKPVREMAWAARREAGHGDCIDCGLCVQVCPTGVDIRQGLQYQCIHCALCIDACDSVMKVLQLPPGLIRYASENELRHRPGRWISAKTASYFLVLLVMAGLLVYSIAYRQPIQVSVRQARQPLYVMLSDGRIQNRYSIDILNEQSRPEKFSVTLQDFPQAQLLLSSPASIVMPGRREILTAYVRAPKLTDGRGRRFFFVIKNRPDTIHVRYQTDFYIPATP